LDHSEPNEPQPEDDATRRPDAEPNLDKPADGSWLDDAYPLVDADFVGSTLDRVLSDRDEIESEAACVEQVRFPAGFLTTYTVPVTRSTFVEDTLARVVADRVAGRNLQTDEDYEFHALIEQAQVPKPSADFVDRTLAAIMQDPERLAPAPIRSVFARRFSVIASLAAIVLCAIVIFWNSERPPVQSRPITAPIAWASLLSEADFPRQGFVVAIPRHNAILDFAADATVDATADDTADDPAKNPTEDAKGHGK
jgi:hypothetical protein